MHGGAHPCERRAPHGPTVARDGVCKQQLLGHHYIVTLTGCTSQPPDPVMPQEVSHAGLAGGGQQRWRGRLGCGGGPTSSDLKSNISTMGLEYQYSN